MIPKNRKPSKPSDILVHDFLIPRVFKYSAYGVAEQISEIINGKSVDDYLAEVLSIHLGTSKEFWLNLQANYDASIEVKDDSNREKGI